MKRITLFLFAILIFSIELTAQNEFPNKNPYPYKTQLGMNFNIDARSKMEIIRNAYRMGGNGTSEYLQGHVSVGGEFGAYLYQRIHKWLGLYIGIEYSASTYCFSSKKSSRYKEFLIDYYEFGAFTFPILLNYSYFFDDKNGLDISLGVAPLLLFLGDTGTGYTFGAGGEESDPTKIHFRVRVDTETRYNASLFFKIGYKQLLKNQNTWGISLIGSYSAEPHAEGNYDVRMGTQLIEEGWTKLYNSYIGIQLSYGFSLIK